ncbi:MAG: hypothetical protein JWM85_1495, partial [Acidimicrobiaceae bacterium]|nr:hypothetical protein [Acidimicrobiaceae bacterium]
AALAAGADLVVYGPVAAGATAALQHRVVAAIVGAVHSGRLARARLLEADLHVLAAKKASLCADRGVQGVKVPTRAPAGAGTAVG